MSNDRNVIELNGSQYDALTGGIITPPVRQSPFQNSSNQAQATQQQQQQQTQNTSYSSYGGNHTYEEERLYTHTTQPATMYGQPQSAPAVPQPTQPVQQIQTIQPLQQAQQLQPQVQTQQLQPTQPQQQVQTQVQLQPEPAQQQQVTEPAQVNVIPASYLPATPALPEVPHVPVAEPTSTTRKPSIARKAAQHATRKKQSTRTLMRHAVKAPAPTHKSHSTHTATTHTSLKAQSTPTHHKPDVTANTSVSHAHRTATKSTAAVPATHTARQQRAQVTIQSDMIGRFRKQPLPRETTNATAVTASPLIPISEKQTKQEQPVVDIANTQQTTPQPTQTDNLFDRHEQEQREQRLWPSADRYRADSPDDTDLDDNFGKDFDANLTDELPLHAGAQPLAKTSAFESGVFEPHAVATTTQQPTQQSTSRTLEMSQIAKLKEQSQTTQTQAKTTQPAEPTSKFAKAPVKEDIFEKALAVASNHQQQDPTQAKLKATKRVKKPRHVMRWAASVAVLLVIIGVVALQNRTAIQLQLASSKAGFSASAPGYKPSGFAMAKISYSPGTVSANYEHDDKSFTVIQKKTTWDSQALLENFVATSNEPYQGYDSKGRTIYVYGQGRATWVNNNVWYQVHADNVLSNEQLVKIASSM